MNIPKLSFLHFVVKYTTDWNMKTLPCFLGGGGRGASIKLKKSHVY